MSFEQHVAEFDNERLVYYAEKTPQRDRDSPSFFSLSLKQILQNMSETIIESIYDILHFTNPFNSERLVYFGVLMIIIAFMLSIVHASL